VGGCKFCLECIAAGPWYNGCVLVEYISTGSFGRRVQYDWLFLVLLLVVSPAAWSEEPPSSQPAPSFRLAQGHFLKGDYDQAAALYEELGQVPANAVRSACGRSEIDLQLGDYEDGIARLGVLERRGRTSADWHACLAALLAEVGRYDEAVRHNRRAVDLDEAHYRAHWQLGRVYETLGKTSRAIEAYAFFDDLMIDGTLPDGADALTYLGRGFLRHSTLTQNANTVRRTRHVLQEVYQEAFHYVDPLYWPARLAAAELLLDKHDLKEAKGDFERICEQNPRVPSALVGLGRIALEHWDFEGAEKQAEAALEVNPNHVAARMLLADLRMTERRYAEAAAIAKEALETNPNAMEALCVLAAAQLRSGDKGASQQTQQRIRAINPKSAELHHVLGSWLSAGRQFVEAERHFEKAIAYAPGWAEPQTELGLLYMETGEEAEARRILEASFALDGFNARTYHVLQLLDRLDGFGQLRTEHFVVKYDETEDAIVAPYFAESLEAMYAEVCGHYGTTLEKPTIIELFPDHLGFSRRIAGRPFIATIGACTGRVIAMASPRAESLVGRFNWKTVLRHEFTHTVTLAATENRIPHWMTEGLAVSEEPAPRSWATKQLLGDAVRGDRLFTLTSIDWGFVRPRRPNDRSLAYAQSEWMIEYIIERFNDGTVLDLLRAFRDKKTQVEAFRQVLHVEAERFDADFKAWAMKQVEVWDLPYVPVEDSEGTEEIRLKLKDNPDDAALLVRLAWAEFLCDEFDEAEDAARLALQQDGDMVAALEILSRILIARMLREKDQAERWDYVNQAEPCLRRLHGLDPDNPMAIKCLGYVEQAWRQWREAIHWLTLYQRRFPEDPDPYRRLAAIYLQQKRPGPALHQLEQLFRLVEDEPAVALLVASIYGERGQHDRAAHWLGRAIEIDPFDVNTHEALAAAFFETGQYSAAEREYLVVCKLLPDESVGYAGLSRVYEAMGNLAEAAAYQKKAEALRGKWKQDGGA